jgi:hypothetical protein
VYLCGLVLVDVGEGRFGDNLVATSYAIVGRLVSFAEVCGGLGKALIEDSHKVLNALVKSRLLLHTPCRHKRRARVLALQPDLGLEEGIAVGFCCVERYLSLWLLVYGQEEGGCRTYVFKLLHLIQQPLCLVLRHAVRKADCIVSWDV